MSKWPYHHIVLVRLEEGPQHRHVAVLCEHPVIVPLQITPRMAAGGCRHGGLERDGKPVSSRVDQYEHRQPARPGIRTPISRFAHLKVELRVGQLDQPVPAGAVPEVDDAGFGTVPSDAVARPDVVLKPDF